MKYSVIFDKVIINTILADSLELAEKASGMNCVDYVGEIGWHWNQDEQTYTPPNRFPSWTWDSSSLSYLSPTPKPEEGDVVWDEDTLSWIERPTEPLPEETPPVAEEPSA